MPRLGPYPAPLSLRRTHRRITNVDARRGSVRGVRRPSRPRRVFGELGTWRPGSSTRRRLWQRLPVLLAALAYACGGSPSPDGQPLDWSISLDGAASPSFSNSAQPQLTASPRGVILSWLERTGSTNLLKWTERTANGWSPPKPVSSGDDWFVSWADVPSVQRLSNGTIAAHWLVETDAAIEAYNLLLSYSTDEGDTWVPPFSPHHDGTTTQHGFASLVEVPLGGLGLVWLDGRDMELNTTDPEGGVMALRFAAFDTTWTQTADELVNLRVCECCPTTAVVTTDGVLTAFRDRDANDVRDIHVARRDGTEWTDAIPVHEDGWTIAACPVNGPMLSSTGGREVVAAWFTVQNDEGRAYAAFSADAGQSWGPPVRLDDGASLGRVDVELLDDGSAVATWIEFGEQGSQFRARRITSAGERSLAVTIAGIAGSRASGYPRIARSGEDLVFAWTESSTDSESGDTAFTVRTAVARK